jgi:hypothetical protein
MEDHNRRGADREEDDEGQYNEQEEEMDENQQ